MGLLQTLRARGMPWLGSILSRPFAGREVTREKARASPAGVLGRLWFLPYVDTQTGETAEMRRAYRMMLKDPTVKAALYSKLFATASLELHATSPVPGKWHKKAAAFVEETLRRCQGGTRGLVEAVALGGLQMGVSVSEKVFRYVERGEWSGRVALSYLSPKDPDYIQIEADEFRHVTGVRSRYNDAADVMPPDWFVIWQHLPLYGSPTGTSDLRAAYRAYWLIDTAWKLRGRHLEKFTSPLLKGTYGADDAVKASLEAAMEKAKSSTWISIPEGAMVEAFELSQRGTADFESAIKDLRHEVFLGITFAFLQSLEGMQTGARSIGEVHQASAETGVWYLASCCASAIQDQVSPDLIDLNYAGAEYPDISLGGVNDTELAASLAVDTGLSRDLGLKLSKRDLYRRYARTEPETAEDVIESQPTGAPPGANGSGAMPFIEPVPGVPAADPFRRVRSHAAWSEYAVS